MVIRKATLEEWFLIYQLDALKHRHFHLPFYLTVDVTHLYQQFQKKGQKMPTTALMVKAAGLVAKQHPAVNRLVFRTFYGWRILEPDYVSVNLPIMLRTDTGNFLTATIFKDVNRLTLEQIQHHLKVSLTQNPKDSQIGKYLYQRRNHFLNRIRLKFIHFLVYHFPRFYETMQGGGIAVSSVMNCNRDHVDLSMMAYGPTAFTLSSCNLTKEHDRYFLKIGIAYDHFACNGETAIAAANTLSELLSGENPTLFDQLLSSSKPRPD